MGGLVLAAGQSRGVEPAPPVAAFQPVAKNFVTIYGQVTRQGKYKLKPPMSVPQILQLAGGAKAGANLKKVQVIRKTTAKNITILVNIRRPEAGAVLVKPGDVIIVDEVLTDF
jgi:protein involved in polysaccharide export with SLBB domain